MPAMRFGLLSILCLGVIGCGTTRSNVSMGPPRAILEVVNRTADDAIVSMDGWWLGEVSAGQRGQFRAIRPGNHQIEARFTRLSEQRSSVDCMNGQVCRCTFLPGADEGVALPAPPALGSLRVTNPFPHIVHLRIGDREERQLLPGTTIHAQDLSAGDQILQITIPGSRTTQALTVPVVGNQEQAVTLALPTGSVDVINQTGEAVRILVDGLEKTTVPDQRTQTLGQLLAGVRTLTAIGEQTTRVHRHTVHLSDISATHLKWDLRAALGTLLVRNQSPHTLSLSMDGKALMDLETRKEHTLTNLPLGVHSFEASLPDQSGHWRTTLSIATGHDTQWTLDEGRGTLWLTNHLTEAVEVHLDEATLAIVPPRGSTILDALPAGQQSISVYSTVSRHIQKRLVSISPHHSARWEITQPIARFHVKNQTPEEVTVYVDRQPLGRIASGKEVIFTQVAPGRRLVEAAGALSGKSIASTLDIPASQTTVWDVESATGTVMVVNQTDEVLIAPPGLRHQGESLGPNISTTYSIAAGNRLLHFVGRASDQSYQHRLLVVEDTTTTWEVKPLEGSVLVFNRTATPQQIIIDKIAATTVAPGKRHTIRLRAGPHHMVAVSTVNSRAVMATLMVRSQVTASWVLQPAQGTVRIVNHTAEILDLRINGAPLGYVVRDSERVFGPFPPGKHKLLALGRWTHTVYETTSHLVDGRTEVWEVHPAQGRVVVGNRRDEAIRIVVDGETHQTLAAHKKVTMSLPLGGHLLELVGVSTHEIFRQRLRIQPNRTYAVEAPAGPAQLRIINALPVPLTIEINGTVTGTVAAQSEQVITLRNLGWVEIHARGPDTTLSWYRRLLVNDDREQTWHLEP